ncbi:hypothetical protein Pelo_16540 [Pelomyxa schiedti]|nr:hypothetical protein Pelo_16540 [Pelomyxa schiedti]
MLGMSIGRLLDKDPGATSVVVRLGYPAVTCWVERVLFNKSAVNEATRQLAMATASSLQRITPRWIVWDMVMDTRRRFVVAVQIADPRGSEKTSHWIVSFGVSPLVLGITDDPTVMPDPLGYDASINFQWVGSMRRLERNYRLHDLVTGEYVPLVLQGRLDGNSLGCTVNHKWFAASNSRAEGGVLEILISKVGDPQPADTCVGVKLNHSSENFNFKVLFFNKSSPNELVVVLHKRTAHKNSAFLVIDAEMTFSSKSLSVLSEMAPVVVESSSYLTMNAVVVTKRDGSRSFVEKGVMSHFRYHCIEFPENCSTAVALPQTENVTKVSQLSSSLFAVSFSSGNKLCDIWDCNDSTKPLVSVPATQSQSRNQCVNAEAEAGMLFSLEGNELRVIEPLSGFTVLHVTLPLDRIYDVGHPFCCFP